MKVLGMEIPDEVAKAIVDKAKTEEFLKEYFKKMNDEWKYLKRDKRVMREVEFRKEEHPGCKILFKIFDNGDYFEMSSAGCPDDNWVMTINITVGYLHDIRCKVFNHLKTVYQIDFVENYPTLEFESFVMDIKCSNSVGLNDLVADIIEMIPEVSAELINEEILRIRMK